MKMNKSHLAVGCGRVATAVIAAGLAASLGVIAPSVAVADEAPATTLEATTQQVPATQAADEPEADTDVVAAAAPVTLAAEGAADDQPAAGAETSVSNPVAKIDSKTYASFDEAVADAKDYDTIELLAPAETKGLYLEKNLTIDGGADKHSLTFTDKGIALCGKALTFKNINVTMSGIGSTPNTADWGWMSIAASQNASLTLDNANLVMDGKGTPVSADKVHTHAIYFTGYNKLNLTNASNLTISNYSEDALEWNGGEGGYNVNITGRSTYTSDHNRSGFTGTFYATINDSTVKVLNSTGNGSNGTYFTIENGSDVTFENNGNWGISAWRIDMSDNSKLHANDNGYSGIWTRVLNVDKTCSVEVERNGVKGTSAANNGGIFFKGNRQITSKIEKGASVTVQGNAGSGIYTAQGVCNLTIGSATITNNGTGACNEAGIGAVEGGGVYNVGTMVLDPSVVIYNNHAANAGDDIYSTGAHSISFDNVGAGWILDDCSHVIDGWYDDAATSRWSAHGETKHVVLTQQCGTIKGAIALKAAHGLVNVDYKFVGDAPEGAKAPDADTNLELGAYTAKAQQPVDGYTFDGWYTDEACTTKWNDGDALTGSMTLYGKWTKNPAAPTTPDSGNKTPDKKLPQTGDTTSAALPALLAGGSLAALGAGIALRRREH